MAFVRVSPYAQRLVAGHCKHDGRARWRTLCMDVDAHFDQVVFAADPGLTQVGHAVVVVVVAVDADAHARLNLEFITHRRTAERVVPIAMPRAVSSQLDEPVARRLIRTGIAKPRDLRGHRRIANRPAGPNHVLTRRGAGGNQHERD